MYGFIKFKFVLILIYVVLCVNTVHIAYVHTDIHNFIYWCMNISIHLTQMSHKYLQATEHTHKNICSYMFMHTHRHININLYMYILSPLPSYMFMHTHTCKYKLIHVHYLSLSPLHTHVNICSYDLTNPPPQPHSCRLSSNLPLHIF